MTPKGIKALDEIAEKAINNHLRQRNNLMLEAVISAYLDTDSPEEVAAILREQAKLLEEWG